MGSLFGHIHLLRVLDQIISDICAHIYVRISLLLLLLLLKKKKKKKRERESCVRAASSLKNSALVTPRTLFIIIKPYYINIEKKREREKKEGTKQ